MPCVYVNTAQEFPNYGKTLVKEEVLKVTEIATPMARFGQNGNDQEESSISDDQSVGDLEQMLPENDGEGECTMETPLVQSNVEESWPIIGKSKTVYGKHSGICIRPQLFPDAVSHVSITVMFIFNIEHYIFYDWKYFRKTSRVWFLNHQIFTVSKLYTNLELLFLTEQKKYVDKCID